MLPDSDFARQLEAKLDETGNGPDAVAALLAALDRMTAADPPEDALEHLDWADRAEADRIALTNALNRLAAADEPEFQPGPEDFAELDDWLERLEYEQDCNARFV